MNAESLLFLLPSFRVLSTSREIITGVNLVNDELCVKRRGFREHEHAQVANIGTPGAWVSARILGLERPQWWDLHIRKTVRKVRSHPNVRYKDR